MTLSVPNLGPEELDVEDKFWQRAVERKVKRFSRCHGTPTLSTALAITLCSTGARRTSAFPPVT